MMKKIAVITPSYNSGKFIIDCINSVAHSLTFSKFEFEHIIIDDFSQDQTKKTLDKIHYPWLRKIFSQTHMGQAAARNFAISQTDADYIFPLDHDDVLTQNGLRYLFEEIEKDKCKWSYGEAIMGDEQLRYLIGKDYYGWNFPRTEDLLTAMLTHQHAFLPTIMYDRNLFRHVGGYDSNLISNEVPDLLIRFLLEGHLPKWIINTVIIRRIHGKNASMNQILKPEIKKGDIKNCFIKYKDRLKIILDDKNLKKIEFYINS